MLLLVRNSHHNSVNPLKLSGMVPLKHLPSNQICATHMKFSLGQGTQATPFHAPKPCALCGSVASPTQGSSERFPQPGAHPSTPRRLAHYAGLWPLQRKDQAN